MAAATEQRDKEGPLYERIVRKQVIYWCSEATRLGIKA